MSGVLEGECSSLEEAIQKADTLIEAMGWIRQFRDKITVIKLGGSILDDQESLRHLLTDIIFMETVGMRPVVVHGGGKRITRAMEEAGIEPRFVHGRRYTDDETLKIVETKLAIETCNYLADELESLGGRAMTLNFESTNVLVGEKLELKDDQGNEVDLGHVGHVTQVDRQVIDNLCYAGQVPFIPSMCVTSEGQKLNVNADSAATAVAQALGAEKLMFLSEIEKCHKDLKTKPKIFDGFKKHQNRQNYLNL